MVLKKFYALTVSEALRDAREQLGESVVLLESVPPEGDRPACVTVMVDHKRDSENEEAEKQDFRNVFYKRGGTAVAAPTAQEKTISKSVNNSKPAERPAPPKITASKPNIKKPEPIQSDEEPDYDDFFPDIPTSKAAKTTSRKINYSEDVEPAPEPKKRTSRPAIEEEEVLAEPRGLNERFSMSRRQTPLIEIRQIENGNAMSERDPGISRDLSAIHRRMERLESMLGESLISANLEYASHPAFQQLLRTGISATTIAGWFKQIIGQGIDPFEEKESFMFEMGRTIRNTLSTTLPGVAQPNMVFVGPSGSGKTSLIMKLATSEDFYGERKIALVSVEPRREQPYYSVLEAFATHHSIPFYRVKDGIDVSKLMPTLVEYDHVLFDTPSVSLERKTAFREYWKIRQILASVLPVEVHFVVNATLQNIYFREEYAANHPLQPDYLAITHLDETDRWGHLLPFIKTMACSVRFISTSENVPDGIMAFSPTWFAEKILSV